MVDYYEELKLEREKNNDEINLDLARLEGIWKRREITNPDKATKILSMIIEARKVFETEHSRKEYDRELDKESVSDMPAEEQRTQQMKKWLDQAADFFNENEYDLARTALERAALYVPPECDDPEYFSLAAQIYNKCGSYDEAQSNINKAIVLDPDYAFYYLEKSDIFLQIAFAYGKNGDMTKFDENINRGKNTLKSAISKAKLSNDNDVEATAMGVMAFLWNNIVPVDHIKAAELAYEALSIGNDKWGNSQKIISEAQEQKKRIEEQALAQKEEKYVQAIKNMESGFREEAVKLFRELGDYKDSKELVEKFLNDAANDEIRRKNSIYKSAVDYMNKTGIDYIRTAYNQFKTISGWKDADELAMECKRKMDAQENIQRQNRPYPQNNITSSPISQSVSSDIENQPSMRRLKGVCQYCGGDFAGFINKTCKQCGRPKDY